MCRDEDGMVCRTDNEPWKAAMAKFTRDVVTRLESLLPRHGGPIILFQIENEVRNLVPVLARWWLWLLVVAIVLLLLSFSLFSRIAVTSSLWSLQPVPNWK